MAKQGNVTKEYASFLSRNGWTVVYVCIPNTVHIGVVPIPTINGASKQRYPDIVAIKDEQLLIVEVEVSLNINVYEDISLRFFEMRASLSNAALFLSWIRMIKHTTGLDIPEFISIESQLVVINPISDKNIEYKTQLELEDILVVTP
ncbi:TPA: hypothetical protein N2898_003778 [Vibrio parahaemolyticus]|nr:hypothetical protein [Vibrio alginolyticus]HCG5907771.1 hypothetical protein [Vibrio parahaemolyticus]MCR9528851.1 hypothetical protein [Vibrio alginolyticus]HCG8548948.1 hypothetical protein [Vibrio parahaemolyticus]HCH0772057.1 hypothetical protein [Vibrio parahaemolyticus]HCH1006784.1 hypothetical protein [Vibrio parahaemolyticus]